MLFILAIPVQFVEAKLTLDIRNRSRLIFRFPLPAPDIAFLHPIKLNLIRVHSCYSWIAFLPAENMVAFQCIGIAFI